MFLFDTKSELLNEFNKVSGLKLQLKDVTFTNAGVWLQNACNAKVTISATASSNIATGSVDLFYNRWRIDEFLANVKLPGKPGTYATVKDVLKMLREFYQVAVYDEDFPLDPISPTATSVTITPRLTSVSWQPPYPVTLSF